VKSAFENEVMGSQAAFRTLLSAMAYPGRVFTLAPEVAAPGPLSSATTATCLCLVDFETPVWLQAASEEARAYLRFHCGARLIQDACSASFAVITDAARLPSLAAFCPGEVEYPDRSATLIVQVPSLENGAPSTWTGPGIQTPQTARIAGLPLDFWGGWAASRELYPLGLDIFFTCGKQVLALPRTIEVRS